MKKFSLLFFCQLFVLAALVMSAQGDEKITICHFPPDNPENPQTITVKSSSLPSHLAHCDTIGECTACTSDGGLCGCNSACCSGNCSEGTCAPTTACTSNGDRCTSSSECCGPICSEEGICASECAPLLPSGEGGQCSFDKPCCPDAGVCILGFCFTEFPTCGLLGDACDEADNPCCFDYNCNGTSGLCEP